MSKNIIKKIKKTTKIILRVAALSVYMGIMIQMSSFSNKASAKNIDKVEDNKTKTVTISAQPKAVISQSFQPQTLIITVQPGWGISHVAKAAGLDYMSENTWNNIANLNGYNNWRAVVLHPGMNMKVNGNNSVPQPVIQQKAPTAVVQQYSQEYIRKRICETFGAQCRNALIIADKESGLRTNAISVPNIDGSRDFGLFQINCRWHASKVSGNCNAFLDLETNLRIAKQIHDQEGGWSRWSTSKYL